MTKNSIAAMTLAAVLLSSAPVCADELARAGNQMLAAQLADAITTRALLEHRGWENDPLARPLVKTNASAVGSAVALNALARLLFRHSPSTLRWFAGIELEATANNVEHLRRH
jgi:hypothetical protein